MNCDVTLATGEEITKTRTVTQASDCRDALARALYGRLFSWIVNSVNQLIGPVVAAAATGVAVTAAGAANTLQIGVLDIFGFENFPQNSFEQVFYSALIFV